MIDLVRLILGLFLLSYASYTDWKFRKVDNKVWVVMGLGGLVCIFLSDFDGWIFVPILLMTGIALLIYFLTLFGGADIKAIIAIAILVPLWPEIGVLPYNPTIYFFPLVVLINSLILFLTFPLYYCLYNIFKRNFEWPYCFLGYKIKAKQAQGRHIWSMVTIKNGKKYNTVFPSKNQNIEDFGNEVIWVTPKVPFIIPLLAGFIISFILGDILSLILTLIL